MYPNRSEFARDAGRRRADRQDRQARDHDRRRERLPDGDRSREPEDVLRPRRALHDRCRTAATTSSPTRRARANRCNNGLSELGKQAVAEMNRLGMMVDVSHIAEKSFWDIIAITKAPIIASHSGCKAVADSDRNLDRRPAQGAGEERRRHPDRGAGELPEAEIRPRSATRSRSCATELGLPAARRPRRRRRRGRRADAGAALERP